MSSRRPTLVMLALAAAVLCLGSFLASRTVRSEVSATLAGAGAAHTQHPPGGFRHQMGGSLLIVLAEETETRDRLPANTAHLTALLLGAFFGAAVWWLGMSTLEHPGSRIPLLPRSWFLTIVCFVQRRRVATLSEVFRL